MEDDSIWFYTVSAASKRLQIHKSTFRRWMKKGFINYVCLIDRSKQRKFLIKQETVNEIIVKCVVQAELERAFEQEQQEEYKRYRKWRNEDHNFPDEYVD